MTLKETKYRANIMLLMFRCGYIGGPKLTKSGKGWFGPKFWRKYNYVMCKLSPKHDDTVRKTLGYYYEKHKIQSN